MKKDISKVLEKGTIKKKLSIIADDIARARLGKPPLLTPGEYQKLTDSITKTEAGKKAYNKWVTFDRTMTIALCNFQMIFQELRAFYANLRGYLTFYNSVENAETMVNIVLDTLTPKQRKKAAREALERTDFFFVDKEIDKEGYIVLNTDKEGDETTLYKLLKSLNTSTEQKYIKVISWGTALKEYIDSSGYNTKTYEETINRLLEVAEGEIFGGKYEAGEVLATGRAARVLDKYVFTIDRKNLEINSQEYNWFKKNVLNVE